ncbi:MAG: PIN domain-containing protein [Parafilimonas sp.]
MKPTAMMLKSFAVDTNILIYLHDASSKKRTIAENILASNPKISTQVISEYLNTTRRLLTLGKADLMNQCAELFKDCEIIPVTQPTLLLAAALIKKYDFQLFDAVIAASALENNCSTLYSEDMQYSLIVNDILTIINPFI